MFTNPSSCRGGEVCDIQPSITVVDSSGSRSFFFQGHAYAQVHTSPTGFESMYVGQDCDYLGYCGVKVSGANAMVSIVNGLASFQVCF